MKASDISRAVETIEKQYGKKLLSIEDVSDYLGIDSVHIHVLVENGNLDAVGSGGILLFKPISLVKFLNDVKADNSDQYLSLDREVDKVKVTEGSFYQTNSKSNPWELSFIITFDDGDKQRVKLRGRNKTEILQKKQDKIAEVVRKHNRSYENSAVPNVSLTFQEVSDEWYEIFLAEQKSKGNSFANAESTKYSLQTVNSVIGSMDIKDIDVQTAQNMIDTISWDDKKKMWKSESHVTKVIRNFKRVMEYAYDTGYTDVHIGKLNMNKNLHKPQKDDRFVDEETLIMLL